MLSTDDYARFGGVIRVNPPVREARNQEPLWAALADGTIDMIATDHAPHAPEEKTRNDIWTVDCGFPGVETQMPLMLTEVECRAHDASRTTCAGAPPTRRRSGASIRARASIQAGRRGRSSRWSISAANGRSTTRKLQSRSKITPWHGRPVRGLPIHTLVRGRFVMRDRALVPETRGWGRSVHTIQQLPAAAPRNVDQTMEAIVRGGDRAQSERAA